MHIYKDRMNVIIRFIFITCTSLLASGHGEPVPCEVTRRFAWLLDTYTVNFMTCYDPKEVYAPSCQCPDSQNITDAWFWRDDASKKRMLKHSSSSFWVTSSELHIQTTGQHWFNFEYSYRCHSLTLCKQGNITLELRVANFHLRTFNTSSTKHARGSNIRFLCSSHLIDSHTVEVRFHFIPHDSRTLNALCPANQSETIPYYKKHWLIHRDHETHDCILEIRNVNQATDAVHKSDELDPLLPPDSPLGSSHGARKQSRTSLKKAAANYEALDTKGYNGAQKKTQPQTNCNHQEESIPTTSTGDAGAGGHGGRDAACNDENQPGSSIASSDPHDMDDHSLSSANGRQSRQSDV